MAIGSTTWDLRDIALAVMTPKERWSAARQIDTGFVSEYGLVLLIGFVLFVLVVLLWWVSSRRHGPRRESGQERFVQNAIDRGLSVRERRILLAVAVRSGLRHNEKVLVSSTGFNKGAKKLLAEFAHTRTPQENRRLAKEVESVREKLGFASVRRSAEPAEQAEPSSRSIPVGKRVELLPQGQQDKIALEGTVVRNDDIELAVELGSAVEDGAGAPWRVRYCFGTSVWEFEAAAMGCEGTRLTFNHSEKIRFLNRQRFLRRAANRQALVALFPLARGIVSGVVSPTKVPGCVEPLEEGRPGGLAVPEFADGVVTEVAGPGLRIRSSLRAREGDRVLVLFGVTDDRAVVEEQNDSGRPPCMVQHIGYVRHCENVGDELSLAVELTGLNSVEMDELLQIAGLAENPYDRGGPESADGEGQMDERFDAGTTVKSRVTQGV
ncbi:MAG: hypothetical protein JW741_30940 [Sedimentisphaerales bacterium]|nr:hypothetical protein [Sedimentisphaerales bacterium]